MKKKYEEKITGEITREDLVNHEVFFPKIGFSLSAESPAYKSKMGIFSEGSFTVSTKWRILAFKKDNKGLILGCEFFMKGDDIQIELFIEVKLEFVKKIKKAQFEHTSFFPVLAIQIAFPFIAEIIAFNSNKLSLGRLPLVPDKGLLDTIIEGLENPKSPDSKNTAK